MNLVLLGKDKHEDCKCVGDVCCQHGENSRCEAMLPRDAASFANSSSSVLFFWSLPLYVI